MDCVELQGVYLLIIRKGTFRLRKFEIWAVLSSNMVDLLMLKDRVFRLLNFQKCAVPSRNGVDLLMLRNRLFMFRKVMKGLRFADTQVSCFEVCKRSHKGCAALLVVHLLMLRNLVFMLRNIQICAVPSWKDFDLLIPRNRILRLRNVQLNVVLCR